MRVAMSSFVSIVFVSVVLGCGSGAAHQAPLVFAQDAEPRDASGDEPRASADVGVPLDAGGPESSGSVEDADMPEVHHGLVVFAFLDAGDGGCACLFFDGVPPYGSCAGFTDGFTCWATTFMPGMCDNHSCSARSCACRDGQWVCSNAGVCR